MKKIKTKILKKPSGQKGIDYTVRLMILLKEKYKKNPFFRFLTLRIIKNKKNKLKAIYDYIVKKVKFVNDIKDIETIQSPFLTLKYNAGDCDDQSLLASVMLESIGYKTNFVITSYQFNKKYTHIYLLVNDKYWFDTTAKKYPNWEKKGWTAKKIY